MSDESMRPRLRTALTAAMRSRDHAAVTALRAALAAIDNAESVDVPVSSAPGEDGPIAGAVNGLGRSESPRRVLADDDIVELVAGQAREREDAADEYERLGQLDAADRLRAEAAVLRDHLPLDRLGPARAPGSTAAASDHGYGFDACSADRLGDG